MMTLSFYRYTFPLFSLMTIFISGCLSQQLRSSLPNDMALTKVAVSLKPQSPVATDLSGESLAFVSDDGLILRSLAGSLEKIISTDLPTAIAFNIAGTELAAVYVNGQESLIRRYATDDGGLLGEISLDGRCEALLSRDGEWLIFLTTLNEYRFGGNLRSHLLRWNGTDLPKSSLLNDATLDRSTLKDDSIISTLHPQLSPNGDEILYLRLHDPPAFSPYFNVVLRHIESGKDHVVAKLPEFSGAATYLDAGEIVAYGDGVNLVKLVDPWKEGEIARFPSAGNRLLAPDSSDLIWIDTNLLHRNGDLLMSFPPDIEPLSFLYGGRLLMRDAHHLWLLSGLPISASEAMSPISQKRILLRKWRAEGLIDQRDYEADLER